MNTVVLVKQVPAISDIEIASDNNLVRVGAPSMLNPVDRHAVEAALAIKDAVGGTVTLLTMGNALAAEILREGIAVGADKGILVSDERLAGSDTLATGLVLAASIQKIGGVDLVITGKRSTDGDTGQIPPAIAQRLGFSLISYASSIALGDNILTATRLNYGGIETVEAKLPAVVSVTEKANTPRDAKIRGRIAAKKTVFPVWKLDDLGLAPEQTGTQGSATKVTELFAPQPAPVGVMIEGDTPAAQADHLLQALTAAGQL